MAQTIDMPAASFEALSDKSNIVRAQLIGERVLATEVFTGPKCRELHEAMDRRLAEAEATGGRLVHRTRIGRNASCPCGSGLKFKKCCIGKAHVAT